MDEFLYSLKILERIYSEDESITKAIDEERSYTKEWMEENNYNSDVRPARKPGKISASEKIDSTRSIFDDIDE
ncbi:hypothetical protein SAMN05660909_03410 [Chitinophaga terrae (ex Kim and Jung 2007)]|uniref:Uncharacterized protein n=1 Tax=Chitinophaga terrae (ex Kim and Jung 2007) TaxID=408074 RepID=A0A1H4DYN0_9BACT|nr:hypothetical protein [Chitinophaga terrae (ex Kim and Jung 2007)]MDQ0104934.1 hypothetical protein [Chitinophaga terrae (ex Kim and Jung 2007)]GEP91267.1 hypothetical protein CTE07_29120 [Chitinophaga terrae (ex Kim and Jung 2007)]SEA77883.1 hypothetical protein SAMN05660909_03410 [Chitinophaga terrae (ex Kim and Jung 2007)]